MTLDIQNTLASTFSEHNRGRAKSLSRPVISP